MKLKFALLASLIPTLALAALDTARIESITGLKGALNEAEGVFKVTAARNEVKVRVDGWQMPPFMGLTSWASFKSGMKSEAMVMGDLVLFPDEVNPAMSAALDAGLSVTALHNHFLFDDPAVYFMHISGEGTVEQLGSALKAALSKVKEIRTANPTPAKLFGTGFAPTANQITAAPLEAMLGPKAAAKDGMVKFVFGRVGKMACGCEVGKEMGINTWAAFAGTDDNALVDGDFCVLESELQPVLKSLRASNINIVAIHQHMTDETPRFLFLHYWGKGTAVELATAIKQTLALQISPPKSGPMKAKLVLGLTLALALGVARAEVENFDEAIPDQPLAGWIATQTGSGNAHWTVEKTPDAPSQPNALMQSGAATYPICIKKVTPYKNGFIEVKFKPVSGREDQAGGVVWRFQDADNYYIARANALEDNVTIYHTIGGRRVSFKNADTKVVSGVWHTLRVEFSGTEFTVIFDGHKVIEANDSSITAAGKVGVWTKADSITLFDDFTYGEKASP